jgi:hypothetical protein
MAYKAFIQALGRETRLPAFGDYAVAHCDLLEEKDMRFIKPLAKLRYAIDDQWYVAVGKNVRDHGYEQFRELCAGLVRKPFYGPSELSEADRYIKECAEGGGKTGNLTTWVWVAVNRHLSKTSSDLANLHAI